MIKYFLEFVESHKNKFMNKDLILIIGVDSFIGRALSKKFLELGIEHHSTSRRKGSSNHNCKYLDLKEPFTLDFKEKYTRAVICIPGGGFRTFDTQNYARLVSDSQKLISGLIHNGVPVTFLSTSAVFSGQSLRPAENHKPDPTNLYGRFKADVERFLIESSAALNSDFQIIRLTKIFSVFSKPVEEWIANWGSGEFVTTFKDLRISPISLDYCVQSLLKIITGPSSGIFHLSGKEDFSYFELSLLLSSSFGFSEKLIAPSSYLNFPSKIDYTPMYAQLGMEGTTKSFPHVHPQEIQDFMTDMNLEFFGN